MGCDIHGFVERKVGDVWELVPDEEGVQHPYYYEGLKDERLKEIFSKKTWKTGRNYDLFGILAGLRSRTFDAIIAPRGLPADVSPALKAKFEGEKDDVVQAIHGYHTPHYYTLPELLAAREDGKEVPCYLDIDQYRKYAKTHEIDDFHIELPRGIRAIPNKDMDRIKRLGSFAEEGTFFTKIEGYKFPYKKTSDHFWLTIIDAMQKLSEDPANIRYVFWFDS